MLNDLKSLINSISNDIYIADMPSCPDNLICLFLSGGSSPQYTVSKDLKIEQPSFQVRVRNSSYEIAMDICEQLKSALGCISNTVINNTNYLLISQQGDIMPLGRDEKQRWEFAINFNVKVTK